MHSTRPKQIQTVYAAKMLYATTGTNETAPVAMLTNVIKKCPKFSNNNCKTEDASV